MSDRLHTATAAERLAEEISGHERELQTATDARQLEVARWLLEAKRQVRARLSLSASAPADAELLAVEEEG